MNLNDGFLSNFTCLSFKRRQKTSKKQNKKSNLISYADPSMQHIYIHNYRISLNIRIITKLQLDNSTFYTNEVLYAYYIDLKKRVVKKVKIVLAHTLY